MTEHVFKAFDKIARLHRDCVITEKLDGTNGLIYIADDFETMKVGSRNQWITPEKDNFGFARWAEEHRDELIKGLGPGYHYGEWWGAGIQRRYGLTEKRFSLFNVAKWSDDSVRPKCCHVVPLVVMDSKFSSAMVETAIARLRHHGSVAAPGFMNPEGIVIFHKAAQVLFKVTLEKDEEPKGTQRSE